MYDDEGRRIADRDGWVHIYPSMLNDLHLTGSELVAYAVVYTYETEEGYSEDGWLVGNEFEHPAQTVAVWSGVSDTTARNTLKRLIDKGLVESRTGVRGGVRQTEYRTVDY